MSDFTSSSVAVVIPVYLPTLDELNLFSLQHTLKVLYPERNIYFICPQSLDIIFYSNLVPRAKFITFDDGYFQSIDTYSRLLLNDFFYKKFKNHEFILICQTDAILFRDEIDYWCNQGYDYIGAPWADAIVANDDTDSSKGQNRKIKCWVGNGGLSLRRVSKCIELLNEFPEYANKFIDTGAPEDLFFARCGLLSTNFSIPDRFTASRFSMEMAPEYYYELNSNCFPMGTHKWWTFNPEFYLNVLGSDADPIRETAIKTNTLLNTLLMTKAKKIKESISNEMQQNQSVMKSIKGLGLHPASREELEQIRELFDRAWDDKS